MVRATITTMAAVTAAARRTTVVFEKRLEKRHI